MKKIFCFAMAVTLATSSSYSASLKVEKLEKIPKCAIRKSHVKFRNDLATANKTVIQFSSDPGKAVLIDRGFTA